MTDDKTKGRGGRPGLPTWVFVVAIGLLAGSFAFYAFVGLMRPEKASWWGVMGDSAGPFSVLFNAGALLAALWAVHLQRIESHDARLETQEQLRLVTRTAAAQDRLAAAQEEANRLAPFQELAQRRANIAGFFDTLVQIDKGRTEAQLNPNAWGYEFPKAMKEAREIVSLRIDEEGKRVIALERQLGINAHEDEE